MANIEIKPLPYPTRVINVGLDLFAEAMQEQGIEVAQVSWEPPVKGDPELMAILDDLL
ncbi:MAG: hypothetical protein OER85_13255 [Gammaproteobacteria bacterium]|nr:hypothetical protein [Gammaproteobacteria bacterium]